MSKIDREAFLGIETATIIKPGDRVLLTVDGRWDRQSVDEAQKLIAERFPDAVFTFVTGVDKVTIAPTARANGICGEHAPVLFGAGLDLQVCELTAGHKGWHGRPNGPGEPWMNWTGDMIVSGSTDE